MDLRAAQTGRLFCGLIRLGSPMDRIFDLQETTVEAPETWVQAKNKTGVD
ncbi:hypothetical protein [Pseudoramibacter alactolyticus]|nr:hypothetical protein [Pseudoramibacter alactolyticus]MBM6969128.1 hypothetical protein [Pseudoramibacter alactolyticus]